MNGKNHNRRAVENGPSVSIVLPTYNQAHFLRVSLESIFAQTYQDFELIVVDDGSNDTTPEILDEYASCGRVQIIRQENSGLPRALNRGFDHSAGKYLTWTSSDNELMPTMLAVLVNVLDGNPAVGLAYADRYLMDDDGQDLGLFPLPNYDPCLILHVNLVHCCFLYRRTCMERIGGYDPQFIYGEDWEYWTRMSLHYSMRHVSQPLYRYRLHRQSMTSDLVRGRARTVGYSKISEAVRRRAPLRWWVGKLKLRFIKSFVHSHPVVRDAAAWREASMRAAGMVPECEDQGDG